MKKHKRTLKKLTKFIKGLPDIKSDSEYKDFGNIIKENEQFASIPEEEKISCFLNVTQELKNQDEGQISDEGLERHRKKKTKKKRRNKKKNYDSSDNDNKREESSDDSHKKSESKNQSRSNSREQRKKKGDK